MGNLSIEGMCAHCSGVAGNHKPGCKSPMGIKLDKQRKLKKTKGK